MWAAVKLTKDFNYAMTRYALDLRNSDGDRTNSEINKNTDNEDDGTDCEAIRKNPFIKYPDIHDTES